MPMDAGFGTSLSWGTTAGFTCQLLDVTPPEASRDEIDVSHYGTSGFKEFIPQDLVDWGEAKFTIGLYPGETPPISAAKESIVITFPDATTWTFDGFMKGFAPKAPIDDKMTADITIKVSGNIEIA